jgi:PAS domain S-box-containing protein
MVEIEGIFIGGSEMINILKIRDRIMEAQKVWRPGTANLNNSTKDRSQIEEKYESLFELPPLRAGEALRESEEKFLKAFRSSPDAIAITTLKEGKYIEINDSYSRITGYSREEVIGHTTTELKIWVKAEDRARMLRLMKECGRLYNEEFNFRMKSGEIHTWLLSAEPINIGGEECLLGLSTDITKHKQAEHELQTILKTALDGFWRTNLEGKLLEVNDSYCKMTGYTREELLKMSVPDVEAVDSPEEITQRMKKIAEQGSDRFETKHKRKDGNIIDVEVSVNYLDVGEGQFFLCARDITERKRAEEALKESEEKYRDLLDNTNELIQSVTPDGRFRYVNNGWKQALGYSDEEIAKLSVFDIVHPDCLEHYRMIFEKIKAGKNVGQVKATFVSKNGSKVVVEGNVTCKFVNGKLVYTRSIYRDITKNKYLEEQMFRLSSAVSMSTDCIVITDFDAKIIDINQKTLEMYGGDSRDELLGRHFLELIAPAEREMVNMDVGEIIEKGSLECREYNMLSKQGRECPVQMSTSLVRDADGKPMGMVRVGRELNKLN